VIQDLGTLGGPDAAPFGRNDRGQVPGYSYISSTPNPDTGIPSLDPFLWENGTMTDFGTLGGTVGFAQGINNRGQVIGQSNLAGNVIFHPFIWDRGLLTGLGTLGGDNGTTSWINDAGQVVGEADLPGSQTHDAFLWKNGVMTDLGNLGQTSFAFAINSKGQVVGASRIDGGTVHAFLWEKGGPMIDLNAFVPSGSSLQQLTHAFNINDRGEITVAEFPLAFHPRMSNPVDMFSYSSHAGQARRAATIMRRAQPSRPKALLEQRPRPQRE
jgi:probable HAF family extracellular repeat protein